MSFSGISRMEANYFLFLIILITYEASHYLKAFLISVMRKMPRCQVKQLAGRRFSWWRWNKGCRIWLRGTSTPTKQFLMEVSRGPFYVLCRKSEIVSKRRICEKEDEADVTKLAEKKTFPKQHSCHHCLYPFMLFTLAATAMSSIQCHSLPTSWRRIVFTTCNGLLPQHNNSFLFLPS